MWNFVRTVLDILPFINRDVAHISRQSGSLDTLDIKLAILSFSGE